MKIDGFDWDIGNLVKCQKHGVSLAEIEALLRGSDEFSPDIRHSTHEQRFVAIGKNSGGRSTFVGFTVRERDGLVLLRPISARYMHLKEAKRHGRQKTAAGSADDNR